MGQYYEVKLSVGNQEDGLWRVEAPALSGCWVDAETLEQGLAEIQEVIALTLDLYKREGWEVPPAIVEQETLPVTAWIPIVLGEYARIKTPEPRRRKAARKA